VVEPARPALVVIFGPPAVGKMTVGQELERITDFRLLHNHRVIDLLTDYFEFGSPGFSAVARTFLDVFFREAAAAGLRIIVTLGWRFDEPETFGLIDSLRRPFVQSGGRVYFAELEAPLAVRLERNETENRRRHKKVDWSTAEHLAELDREHRWNTAGDFPFPDPHLRLDNSGLSPAEAARRIEAHFGLGVAAPGTAS
jgi:hypothetical protein